jgi:hypothetical protein
VVSIEVSSTKVAMRIQLSTTNKLLLYKTILKPIWTYGIQLWGTASTSNIEILERLQSKVLRMIVDATEMGSGTMTYIPSFIKIGSGTKKLIWWGWGAQAHTGISSHSLL